MSRPWPPRDDASYAREAEERLGAEVCGLLRGVKALVFDCDGVLTDGRLYYNGDGEAFKAFHAHDGLGLVMARAGGLKLALLTGRESPAAVRRAAELKVHVVKSGRFDKQRALLEIVDELGLECSDILYMGDDLIDVPALDMARVAVCVPEACADVRDRCAVVTEAAAGRGAAREVAELVLKAQGLYCTALTRVGEKAWLPTTASGGDDA